MYSCDASSVEYAAGLAGILADQNIDGKNIEIIL